MFVTCPKCFSADDVSYRRMPDQMVEYVCAGDHGEHVWIASQSAASWTTDAVEGVTDELMEPLLQCVVVGEPFVEYGIVEHRLMLARPDLFAAHVRDRGHVMLAPGVATASSVRFAAALGRLARTGELVSRYGPATGAWSYNTQVTYWARPPAPTGDLSWSAYCVERGRPDTWTDRDRAAAAGR
ncbi:MAG: hypothetical protein L0I24_09705 [Pseudonocardia sp.]|nr:hypothetical protein [Pseudonocardia sp.]